MLALQRVSKSFFLGRGEEAPAVTDVSLEVESGAFVTMIGSNGVGKSTLLNLIAGVYSPSGGRIVIAGHDVTRLREHRRARFVGRVYQDPKQGVAPTMTLAENLAMALKRGRRRGLHRAVTKETSREFASWVEEAGIGLESRLNIPVSKLSGGQRQALALLMATISRPSLLLLDEHTASLDPGAARTIMDLTERLVRAHGLTTLMVTHNMQQAIEHGNRLLTMHGHRIVLDIGGNEKAALTVAELVRRFRRSGVGENDRLMLSTSLGADPILADARSPTSSGSAAVKPGTARNGP